jgi:hypothetical protein
MAGIEQQHRLGAYLRTRYGTLLSSVYHPSEFVVRSTDIDRTLMSAQSNLVGLYPALNATSDKVPIQPIPIHTVSINLDFVRLSEVGTKEVVYRYLFSCLDKTIVPGMIRSKKKWTKVTRSNKSMSVTK